MLDLQKLVIFIFAALLLFYMIRLSRISRNILGSRSRTFTVLIVSILILTVNTFLDLIRPYINLDFISSLVHFFFTVGGCMFIVGIILWSNYTKDMLSKYHSDAIQDTLTGILNRNGIEDVFNSYIRAGEEFYFLICDLNGTKRINDTLGHLSGDDYLKSAAEIIKNSVGFNGFISRIGGDEFVVLMRHLDNDDITRIINKIKSQIAQINPEFKTGIGIGYSSFPEEGHTFKKLLEVADIRMYRDKKNYR